MLVGHAIVLVYVNMVFKGQKKSFSLKGICGECDVAARHNNTVQITG